jgi:hypothetical protein
VTQRVPQRRGEDELKRSGPVHRVGKNPIEGEFSIRAAGFTAGDFGRGSDSDVRQNGQKFAE